MVKQGFDFSQRQHLFISYATEDSDFTDWLAFKLASEGYRIWYDRIKLLGGESYPHDITDAIRNKSFRVIAVLSRSSISKTNPCKERTLALNMAREQEIDFLIPLNLDGLRPTELDFMTSDLSYISFNHGWYEGFVALLNKLTKISAPKFQENERLHISDWLITQEQPVKKNECLWSNILPIISIPKFINRYSIPPEINTASLSSDWSFYGEGSKVWAFNLPHNAEKYGIKELDKVETKNIHYFADGSRNILTALIRICIENKCLQKGMRNSNGFMYFTENLIPNDKLHFTRYDGKKTFVKVIGERTCRFTQDKEMFVEKSRYHLASGFQYFYDLFGDPMIRVQLGVAWTDLYGNLLDDKKSNRRRKALCKNWWNYAWYSRIMAFTQWLGEGKDEIDVIEAEEGNLRISAKPLAFQSDVGINEETLATETELEEIEILEVIDEEDEEDGTENIA